MAKDVYFMKNDLIPCQKKITFLLILQSYKKNAMKINFFQHPVNNPESMMKKKNFNA